MNLILIEKRIDLNKAYDKNTYQTNEELLCEYNKQCEKLIIKFTQKVDRHITLTINKEIMKLSSLKKRFGIQVKFTG